MVEKVSHENLSNYQKVKRSEIQSGDKVVVEWDPFDWAMKEDGYVSRHKAEVISNSQDTKLKLSNGKTITDLCGRNEVTGTSENASKVSDYAHIGYGINRYYK